MAIRKFDVGGRKSLVRAALDAVPDLVFITGGNGAGKSSLLMLLKERGNPEPGTKVMHVGPHRPWRKQTLQKAAVLGLPMSYNELLATQTFPAFENTLFRELSRLNGSAKDPDASDESQSIVKASLAAVNEKYRDRLQQVHRKSGRIEKDDVDDPFRPIRSLLEKLLPHLIFDQIDESNKRDIRVLFTSRYSSDQKFDIDFLSSGEKAILSLFLPVLEYQMDKILGIVHGDEKRTFIIDEPELHLHPGLQADVVAYLRNLTTSDNIQFILATHSPTIIECALPDELFLLSPWQSSATGNQLSKLADTQERLMAIRELLGSAYAYSRTRPIIFIEGEFPSDTSRHTDLGLLELIIPDLRGYVFVPSKGRSQAIASAERLRKAANEQEHAITAFALVDADYEDELPSWAFPWPVCMVENLLLEASAITNVLAPYRAKGALGSALMVEGAIRQILEGLKNDECLRRLKISLGKITVRPDVSVIDGKIQASLSSEHQKFQKKIADDLQGNWLSINTAVDKELLDGTAKLHFHGKTVLARFFSQYVIQHIPKYSNFVFQVAREIGVSDSAKRHVESTINKINHFFPSELISFLRDSEVQSMIERAGIDCKELCDWADRRLSMFKGDVALAQIDGFDQEKNLVVLMRSLQAHGSHDLYTKLRPLVVDILAR